MGMPTFTFGPGTSGHAAVAMTDGTHLLGASVSGVRGAFGVGPIDVVTEPVNDVEGRRLLVHPKAAGRLTLVPRD